MYFWNIFLSQFDFSMPFKMYHLDINVKLYGLLPVDEDTWTYMPFPQLSAVPGNVLSQKTQYLNSFTFLPQQDFPK